MQTVIDIPENINIAITRMGLLRIPDEMQKVVDKAIQHGTPLPRKHGRLIILSEDAVKREQTPFSFSCQNWISEVGLSNATVAIIEANKGESKDKA